MIPMVYKIQKVDKTYVTVPYMPKFRLPEKIYGDAASKANYVFNYFKKSGKSSGIILTGPGGTGKTETSNILANIGLANGMPVVLVTEIKADIELISFLSTLSNTVLYFDEYGKYFDIILQDKMLTMLNDLKGNNNLVIVTENELHKLNRLILNRPGRARYHFRFERIARSIVDEVCKDYNVTVAFKDELMKKYDASPVFTFDYLYAIVTEHVYNPVATLDQLLDLLNLSVLSKDKMLVFSAAAGISNNKKYKLENSLNIKKSAFDKGANYWMNLIEVPEIDNEVKEESNTTPFAQPNPSNLERVSFNINKKLTVNVGEHDYTLEYDKRIRIVLDIVDM